MTTIRMPQLGETIVEGTVLKWLKQEGETIERDEPLFEISTDKVDTEVPSSVGGTVTKILVQEGQTVPVGTELAEVTEDGEAGGAGAGAAETTAEGTAGAASLGGPAPSEEEATSQTPSGAEPPSEATPAASAPSAAEGASAAPMPDRGPRSRILSPLVRRLADEHGLDLAGIEGTGTGGRITKNDVLAAIDSGGAPAAVAAAPAAMPAPAQAPPATAVASVQPAVAGPGEEVVPVSHIRKLIGQHMIGSLQTSARAWTMVEVNVDHLVKLRERAKEAFKAKHGVNLTYLPFVIRATCDALLTHPEVNAELRGDEIVLHRYVHMGIAVSYDEGLIVPVIKGADAMNTVGLARAIADLAGRARAHQLKPDEILGSTFTITNPGPYGSIASVPIINQPNTGILSLDAIQKRPVVIDDTIAIRSMVNISMSWDHRTIDGEIATRFLARVKQNLESWDFAEDVAV
jgi:2-oxoglutarate dehydrogenase E2 component (dihydrolipoamide succinyltransferase)